MIRRLVVNLVANAIRETAEGGSVLVRVQPIRGGEALRWSVVDQGRGISDVDMQEIAERQGSLGGGEGLGLSICRQLSALHFSDLRMESRQGTGTAVSFDTAAAGTASVAECWSRWRVGQREPLRKPISREQDQSVVADTARQSQMRIDTQTNVVELASEGTSPMSDDRVAAGTVTLGAEIPSEIAESFDALLQGQARMFDFIYRVDMRQWVWVFDANIQQAEGRIDTISEKVSKTLDNTRLSWSEPQVIPLDRRRTANRLGELLVRQSLAAATVAFDDSQEAHSFEEPIEPTTTASNRLDRELHRLSTQLKSKNKLMRDQSKRLRPNF